MLRFQTPPDKIFTAILEISINLIIDRIKEIKSAGQDKEEEENEFKSLLPFAGKVFNCETALKTLRRMLVCHRRPGLYSLNDYHYLMLYDILQYFCEIHNDMVRTAPNAREKKRASKAGAFYIEKINFADLIGIYFYDIDFLLDADTMINLGIEKRKELGIQDETFGISQGLSPHPEELRIRAHKNEKPILIMRSRYWSPDSMVYPDMEVAEE
ncbi:MAG TPA: hypothetical protein ENG83_00015 [Nitrospirae bacterium]|nr:hypothetical protein BMS3Abin06_02781 [bacterium BMS3Abin06]HDH10590.1 hypothetical protein [Nitrospirota bacterium]HDZ00287.1 hypothetical protein [Nitrospirota bacterium]